jgi:hypothetical protein
VFDVRGRLVHRLDHGQDLQGLRSGTGSLGRKLPAGIYFVRTVNGPDFGARRLFILR